MYIIYIINFFEFVQNREFSKAHPNLRKHAWQYDMILPVLKANKSNHWR